MVAIIKYLLEHPILLITLIIFLFIILFFIYYQYLQNQRDLKNRLKAIREENEARERAIQEENKARERYERDKFSAIHVSNIDSMTGVEFEKYLKKLLITLNFDSVILTKASGDFGVDLIAKKGNLKIAIQAKRQLNKVSRHAISDAVAGMQHYNCNKSMVITNNYFTRDAIKFSSTTNCQLINRDNLANMIISAQKIITRQQLTER